MYPNTPTPIPYATPIADITLPGWRVWTFADDALTVWQMLPSGAHLVAQIAVLLVLFIVFVVAIRNWMQGIGDE